MNPSPLNTALAGRYSIERELGRGGMATVFLGKDLRHDRAVAIKVLDPELGAVIGVDRFLSEIRVTANLQHPNLLPLFDSGAADGMLFYVMPYIEGETLRARLDREKQLPVDEAVRIALAIANALDYAHAHGVVHRDLKPENILLQHREPIIADFGIALAVSNAGGSRVTQTGISLGTPQYMSPEQAMADRAIDHRSDIYSLAALLYEMLSGQPPHTGSTGQAIIAKLMTEEPVRLATLRRSVPPHVEATVHRGLEKLPADRWSTAREFADALRGAGATTLAPMFARRAIPARSWMPYAIAAAALVVALGEAVFLRRTPVGVDDTTLRFPFVTPDREEFRPVTPGIPIALSPDGRRVAYVGAADADSRMYVLGLDDMRSRALGSPTRPLSPAFSPDGKWVAMAIPGRIVKTSVDGGTMTTVRALAGDPAGMAWADPDTIIASVEGHLEAIPVDGGTPVVLSRPDVAHGELQQWGPRVIDSRFIAYVAVSVSGISTHHLAILDRKTGTATQTPYFATTVLGTLDRHLVWVTATGKTMAAAVDRNGKVGAAKLVLEDVMVRPGGAAKAAISTSGSLIYQRGVSVSQLMIVDTSGAKTPFGLAPRAYAHPRWSPDGSRIAVSIARTGGGEIWLIDVRTKTLSKLTGGTGSDDQPEWTPDGKRVLYRSAETHGTTLKWIAADGSERDGSPLTTSADAYYGNVSHDGKWLVYRTSDPGQTASFRDIYRIPLSAAAAHGGASQPLVVSPASEMSPTMSPDMIDGSRLRPTRVAASRWTRGCSTGPPPARRCASHQAAALSRCGRMMGARSTIDRETR